MSSDTDSVSESHKEAALAYLKGELNETERSAFEEALTESEALREELTHSRALLDSLESASNPAIVRLVSSVIGSAIDRGASDIHILPQRKNIDIQIRVDGSLRQLMTLPKNTMAAVVDRWKVMSDMQIGEDRVPQDGRFPVKHNNQDFDLRVSILPTFYGERITARILGQSSSLLGFDKLSLSVGALSALRRLAQLESGLILTGGHSGSGKTTLLYSLLLDLQATSRRGRSLMTVEDPIETQLNGVSQTQTNSRAGLTFVTALRSMLRCDADVILCGELRDREAADLCVHCALMGQLVLSALHTNSALDTIQRLRNIGVENFLIADTLAGAIGQRLVRRIDPALVEEYEPADEELKRAGLTRDDGPFRRGVASDDNGGTGYKGRIPIIEVVEITQTLRRMIAENAPLEDLWRVAFQKGGSLRDDGRAWIKAGLTTVEEVNRVLSNYPY